MTISQTARVTNSPDFILYAQHGWADTSKAIASLAKALATPQTTVVAPSLGWVMTWLRIEPLIERLERVVFATTAQHPQAPLRIVGHSMGGLIWLEVLNRHPHLRSRVHSLVLVASPVGGSDLARIIDPFGWGIGIARDLGKNRRPLAESIAAEIPTLVIAGDLDGGSDGTIPVESTKVAGATFTSLSGLAHAQLKNAPQLLPIVQNFWQNPAIASPPEPSFATRLIRRLQAIPGMTDGHPRNFSRSKLRDRFPDGSRLLTGKSQLGIDRVFVANSEGKCLYSGFVGWSHAQQLHQMLEEICAGE